MASEGTTVVDGSHIRHTKVLDDPLLAYELFPFRQTFYPLGFAVEIETNNIEVLSIAATSWKTDLDAEHSAALKLKIGVTYTNSTRCPPSTQARAQNHLFSITADAENFVVFDLRAGFAFGWITTAVLHHPSYLRYCILDAAVKALLCSRHVTPLHAACVSYSGRGFLLSGHSGAGKSTLAYACARQGWTYTSDDASYLRWDTDALRVRGNSRQFRFRPSAQQLFPELQGRSVTPRIEGEPSIEVPVEELPDIIAAEDVPVHAFIVLDRHVSSSAGLTRLRAGEVLPLLEQSLFPLPLIRELQRPALQRVLRTQLYMLHYRDLEPAIARLRWLADRVDLMDKVDKEKS
jgi:hypothetical protein